ncbi:BID domain-containing T4SS effector [Bartonella sp. B10]
MKTTQTDHSVSLTPEELNENQEGIDASIFAEIRVASQNFYYSDSRVLKNKYRITESPILNKECAHDVAQEMINFRKEPLPDTIDSSYLRHIHKRLFRHTFEWAGHTRDKPFMFADGSVALMPILKKKEFTTPFAVGEKIEEGLNNLDKMLAEKNYLRGSTREEFVECVAEMMTNLHNTHPFRAGNKRTQRMFFEKLAESVGHKLDFSLVTRRRNISVNTAAMEHGDSEPMRHLLEDISHPEKALILNEFISSMKDIGLSERNYRPTVVAQDGCTYNGTYQGGGANGFMIDVGGTAVLGNKKDLTPEQLKTLKVGDRISFTAPVGKDLKQSLIPEERIAPLTKEEIALKVQEDALVQESIKRIELLSQVVYGKTHIVKDKIPEIKIPVTSENIVAGEKFAREIGSFPQSISRLAGVGMFCIKSGARALAEENILPLSHAVYDYVYAIKQAEKDILHNHHMEQKRCGRSVEMPSKWLKNLLSLPKEQQEEVLLNSPELKEQVDAYVQKISDRLSAREHKALRENKYEKLAKSIGTSARKAEEIAKIFKQTKEVQQNVQHRSVCSHKVERPKAVAMTG